MSSGLLNLEDFKIVIEQLRESYSELWRWVRYFLTAHAGIITGLFINFRTLKNIARIRVLCFIGIVVAISALVNFGTQHFYFLELLEKGKCINDAFDFGIVFPMLLKPIGWLQLYGFFLLLLGFYVLVFFGRILN